MARNEQITSSLVIQQPDSGLSPALPNGSVSDANVVPGIQLVKISGVTQGSVPFVGASTTFPMAEDNANFFYDSTNKSLRIGKSTTTSGFGGGLEIKNGTGNFSGILSDNGGRVLKLATSDYVNSTNTGSVLSFTMGAATGNTSASMQVFNAGTSLSTGTLLLQASGGSIGIGTSTIDTGINVQLGNAGQQNVLEITGASGGDTAPVLNFFRAAISNWAIAVHSSNNLLFTSNGHNNYSDAALLAGASILMRADNSNVGIKSAINPATTLVVGSSGNNGMITAFNHTSNSSVGTTAQGTGNSSLPAIASGTFTPTNPGSNSNVAALAAPNMQWLRVGNVVTVSGAVNVQATAANVDIAFSLSLPVLGTIAGNGLAGYLSSQGSTGLPGLVNGDPTNNAARFAVRPSSTTNTSYYYHFSYVVA